MEPKIIIDNGSDTCKAGYSGDVFPSINIPMVVGRSKVGESYVGFDALSKRNILDLNYPIEKGIITHWDNVEKVWHHIFANELKINPMDYSVLLTDSPFNTDKNKEKMNQMMFEIFGVSGLCIASQPFLALVASSRTTGTVLEIGDSVCHAIPIFESTIQTSNILSLDLSGKDLTNHLFSCLNNKGYSFSHDDRDLIKDMKEKLCYVPMDYDHEINNDLNSPIFKTYKLPNGTDINLGNELFKCPEALFQPSLLGRDFEGVHQCINNSINNCEVDIRKDLYNHIVLAGGSTLFSGFTERLQKEMTILAPSDIVQIIAPTDRKNSVWMGGTMIASHEQYQPMWISKQDYEEDGPSRFNIIIRRKYYEDYK